MQYAEDVCSGRLVECKLVKAACERHQRDELREATDPSFPYTFDLYQAERMVNAIQMFKHIKGEYSGERIVLEPWQKFAICSLFWWVDRESGYRRFRTALIAVGRGNGKSSLLSALALAMLALDGEGGAEVYAAAVTRDQARIVFDVAKTMVEGDKEFQHRYGVEITAHSIVQPSTASVFRPLSRDARSLDGLNVHFGVCDEIAQHRSREVWDVLQTATGKRKQPMLIAITTAGNNLSGVGYELWKYSQMVLEGQREDDRLFAVIYAADEGDDWTVESTWRKANPNWNVSVMPEAIETLCRRAQTMGAQQPAFLQKHLNLWTGAAAAWLNMEDWKQCRDLQTMAEQLTIDASVLGLDMATKIDLTALVNVTAALHGDVTHYYIKAWAFIPEDTVQTSPVAQYITWAQQGWLTITDGGTTDYAAVEATIIEWCKSHRVSDLAFDPWQSLNLCKKLEREQCIPVIELRPTVANFSPAMREIEALVREHRIHHDGNPMLEWCLQNIEVYEDRKENIYPRKASPGDPACKIDLGVALITAFARHMALDAAGQLDVASLIF